MTDRFTVRAVVCFLGAAVILAVGVAGYLSATEHELPEFIVSIGSAAIGALGALLSRTSSAGEGEGAVEVSATVTSDK